MTAGTKTANTPARPRPDTDNVAELASEGPDNEDSGSGAAILPEHPEAR